MTLALFLGTLAVILVLAVAWQLLDSLLFAIYCALKALGKPNPSTTRPTRPASHRPRKR